jgi:hypothetical protein
MGTISDVDDVVDAIVYLTEARHLTGEVLHLNSGAHNGKWKQRKDQMGRRVLNYLQRLRRLAPTCRRCKRAVSCS